MQTDHLRLVHGETGNVFLWSRISQSFSGLYWLMKFVRAADPEGILELGTGDGSLTSLFGLCCLDNVVTCDLCDGVHAETADRFDRLGITYLNQDVLDPSFAVHVMEEAMVHPTLVFCDAGAKQKEFALYAPLLHRGDSIAVHDLGTEFFVNDRVKDMEEDLGLTRVFPESEADGSLLAFWRKG